MGADGTIYVGGADNNLHALNPDGSLKWKFATGNWVESSPAVGANGTLYFGSDDGNVYAVGTPPPPPPVNCKSLVQSIENISPKFTVAQCHQALKDLQQCVARGQMTQQQANELIDKYLPLYRCLPFPTSGGPHLPPMPAPR